MSRSRRKRRYRQRTHYERVADEALRRAARTFGCQPTTVRQLLAMSDRFRMASNTEMYEARLAPGFMTRPHIPIFLVGV